MNPMTAKILRAAALALVAFASTPHLVCAQTAPPGTLPITVTLMVPVQVNNLDPTITAVAVYCTAQPVGGSAGVAFDQKNNFGRVGPVANGTYTGTAKVVLNGWSTQSVTPGQQWSYQCHSMFLTAKTAANGQPVSGTPGVDSWAALATTSGPNLVQGTFTTQ
jgi:hypothetical protein